MWDAALGASFSLSFTKPTTQLSNSSLFSSVNNLPWLPWGFPGAPELAHRADQGIKMPVTPFPRNPSQ